MSRVRASSAVSPRSANSARPSKSCRALGLADGDHDRHRFRQQPSRDEAEDQPGGGVQPLSVVHETEQRPLLGHDSQQAEHGQSDQEPLGTCPDARPNATRRPSCCGRGSAWSRGSMRAQS